MSPVLILGEGSGRGPVLFLAALAVLINLAAFLRKRHRINLWFAIGSLGVIGTIELYRWTEQSIWLAVLGMPLFGAVSLMFSSGFAAPVTLVLGGAFVLFAFASALVLGFDQGALAMTVGVFTMLAFLALIVNLLLESHRRRHEDIK